MPDGQGRSDCRVAKDDLNVRREESQVVCRETVELTDNDLGGREKSTRLSRQSWKTATTRPGPSWVLLASSFHID